MTDTDFDFADDDPFWDTFYDLENLLDYWQDYRIDHAYVTQEQWRQMIDF
jgi:hypothetical protein